MFDCSMIVMKFNYLFADLPKGLERHVMSSLHRTETFLSLLEFLCLSFRTPVELLRHYVHDAWQDRLTRRFSVDEGDRHSSADDVIRLDGHLALDGVEDL